MKFKRILALLLTVLTLFSLTACGMDRQTVSDALDTASALLDTLPDEEPVPDAAPEESPQQPEAPPEQAESEETLDEDGIYTAKADGRTYTECDINTLGADSRGAERLVFSNDGLIYYTGDHYESFTLLYGEEPS